MKLQHNLQTFERKFKINQSAKLNKVVFLNARSSGSLQLDCDLLTHNLQDVLCVKKLPEEAAHVFSLYGCAVDTEMWLSVAVHVFYTSRYVNVHEDLVYSKLQRDPNPAGDKLAFYLHLAFLKYVYLWCRAAKSQPFIPVATGEKLQ